MFLLKARRVAARFEASQLHGPLTKMIFLAAETGGFTTIWACVAIAVYKSNDQTNASVGLGYCLGRVYTLTMLFCLFQRKSITANNASSAELQTGNKQGRFGNAASRVPVSGVQVHHGQTIVVDDGHDELELSAFGQRSPRAGHPFTGEVKVDPGQYMIGTDEDLDDEKASGRRGVGFDAV